MRPRHTIVATVAVAVGLAFAGIAQASFTAFADGNDRPGRLDIKQVTQDHGAGGRLVHTITTFGRWPKSLLGPSTPNFFVLDISIDGDPRPERYVFIFSTANGRMVAVVTKPNGRVVGSATASKPNAKTVKVSFLPSRLGNPAGYRWLAASVFRGRGCRGGCTDRAPNNRVLHDIRAPVIVFPAAGSHGDSRTTSTSTSPMPADRVSRPGSSNRASPDRTTGLRSKRARRSATRAFSSRAQCLATWTTSESSPSTTTGTETVSIVRSVTAP